MKTNGRYPSFNFKDEPPAFQGIPATTGRKPKPYPSFKRLPAITRGREGWYVDQWTVTPGKRITGRMMNGNECVREAFDVQLDDHGRFKVDVGTGSGVRVAFEVTL